MVGNVEADCGGVADAIFVSLVLGFFALAVGLVKLCERIVGGAEMTSIESAVRHGPGPRDDTDVAA